MSQVDVSEVKSAGSIPTNVTSKDDNNANSNSQPNVRHIPIFVEGRDEPIINRNIHINSENVQKPVPTIDDCPPQSIFNRAKNIPVRKPTTNFDIPITNIGGGIRSDSPIRTIPIKSATTNYDIPVANINRARSESPGRTIPIKVEHIQTKPKSPVVGGTSAVNNKIPNVSSQLRNDDNRSRSPSPMPPKPQMDSITKIQLIQKEIIELMKRVEMFGGTRKDKEYMYLDEMLTQNLLKLDTIDTEGKENIKAARKEAINCINKCIAVLEAKVEQGEKDAANTASTDVKETGTKMDTDESQTNVTNPEQTQNSEKMNIEENESEQKSQNDSDNRNKLPESNP